MSEKDDNGSENKVIFLGEAGVGKTSLLKVSIGETFNEVYSSSISLSFNPKEILYNNKKYIFNLWDTIGQEKYKSLTKIFYKKSKLVIFVYDITSKKSFENLKYWIQSVNEELSNEKYIKAIVGNKSDLYLKEEVSEAEGKQYASENNAKFKLCSAKTDPLSFTKFLEELCIDVMKEENIGKEGGKKNVKINKKNNNVKKKRIC